MQYVTFSNKILFIFLKLEIDLYFVKILCPFYGDSSSNALK